MPRKRYPNIVKGPDGRWHAYLTVGTKPNGRPDQRHISRKTRAEVEDRVDELLDQVKTAAVVKRGRQPTVADWLSTYLGVVAPRKIDPTTVQGYASKMRNYVLPVIGKVRLDRLTPDHLDAVYLAMQRAGRAEKTILQTHRILSRALHVAHQRSLVPRNVAKLVDPPTAKSKEITPLSLADARAVLAAARGRRNAARWSVGLSLGLRQGEALGLRWSYVDLEAGTMRVWWQLHRRAFEHGCNLPCGRRRAGNCPQRTMRIRGGEELLTGGLLLKEPKGKSKRTISIPAGLVAQLRAHREVQELEKMTAEDLYVDYDLVFADVDGTPVDPARDWRDHKGLLAAAGVRAVRVHDDRHTAATMLLALGAKIEEVQEILGHSSITVTRGYVHVVDDMMRAATDRVGEALFNRRSTP